MRCGLALLALSCMTLPASGQPGQVCGPYGCYPQGQVYQGGYQFAPQPFGYAMPYASTGCWGSQPFMGMQSFNYPAGAVYQGSPTWIQQPPALQYVPSNLVYQVPQYARPVRPQGFTGIGVGFFRSR